MYVCVYIYIHRIYSEILLSHKNEIMPLAATWMDREIIILSEEVRQTNVIRYHLYVKSKTMILMN